MIDKTNSTDFRIKDNVKRGKILEMEFDGEKIIAFKGETIAAALIAAGKLSYRKTAKKNEPRGMYCGIGICYECRMIVDGQPNVRICQTLVKEDCMVQTQTGNV